MHVRPHFHCTVAIFCSKNLSLIMELKHFCSTSRMFLIKEFEACSIGENVFIARSEQVLVLVNRIWFPDCFLLGVFMPKDIIFTNCTRWSLLSCRSVRQLGAHFWITFAWSSTWLVWFEWFFPTSQLARSESDIFESDRPRMRPSLQKLRSLAV